MHPIVKSGAFLKVIAGANYLDEHDNVYSNWRNYVDVNRIQMENPQDCVLAQVGQNALVSGAETGYYSTRDKLGIDGLEYAVELGFTAYSGGEEFAKLAEAWRYYLCYGKEATGEDMPYNTNSSDTGAKLTALVSGGKVLLLTQSTEALEAAKEALTAAGVHYITMVEA